MFSEVVGTEILSFRDFDVRKASDTDIAANKFRRLSDTDVGDINFLSKNSGKSKREFASDIFAAIVKKLVAERANLEMEFRILERKWVLKMENEVVRNVYEELRNSEYYDE